MNSFILSCLVILVALFHLTARTTIQKGKVREAFCALWCIDAVFAVSGTFLIFTIYHYDIAAFLTLRNLLLGLAYLLATFLLVLLAPSGLTLLTGRKNTAPEQILHAEYRFNDTLCLIRNFFLTLLFVIPFSAAFLAQNGVRLPLFRNTGNLTEICGAFCFIAFLILLPVSLRQAFFWLKHLSDSPDQQELQILKQYCMTAHYKKRNLRL